MALTVPADAKIIYTPTHEVIKQGFPYFLSFGRTVPFEILVFSTCVGSGCGFSGGSAAFDVYWKYSTGGRRNYIFGGYDALALKKGAKIPPGKSFATRALLLYRSKRTGSYKYSGNWLPGTKNRYLGLKFFLNGAYHYGWARMSIRAARVPAAMVGVLTGYAYETIPGKPIIAGREDNAVEHGTLGRLALGKK
jgi:hypothetical protein